MERFKEGQKVRVLTMEEILKKGYFLDGDGDIYVGEDDEFFVKSMCNYCNFEHVITTSEDKKQQFTIKGFHFTPGMCEEIKEDNKMKIRIKYFEGATKLKKIDKGNWIDVYARKDVFVPQNERAMIPLGFALELPKGWEGHLAPRSSTFKTWGIIQTNSVGVVDDTYIGDGDEWHMPVYCLDPKDFYDEIWGTFIRKGDKIAQFRIMEVQPEFDLIEVDHLDNEDRKGFGSTGSK